MKRFCLIIFLIPLTCFGQFEEREALKKYKSYKETNIEGGRFRQSRTITLSNGLIYQEKICFRYKKKHCLYSKYIHDNNGNVIGNIEYDKVTKTFKDTILYNPKYDKKGRLIQTRLNCIILKYANFNEQDQIQRIEKEFDSTCSGLKPNINPYKVEYVYDKNGKIIQMLQHSLTGWKDAKGRVTDEKKEKETTYFSYNTNGNVVSIKREYDPKQEFPIQIYKGHVGGGMYEIYEKETFRYVYNKDGLWIKKFKKVNGKESLVAKRSYKKL